jgi:DNA processing protein
MTELAPLASALAQELQSQIEARPGGNLASRQHAPEQEMAGMPDDPDYQKLWAALEFDPLGVDELVRITGLPVSSVSSMLLMLELQGRVEPHSSGRYSRKRSGSRG